MGDVAALTEKEFPLGGFCQARQCLGVGSLPPQRVDRQVAGGSIQLRVSAFQLTATFLEYRQLSS